MRGWRGSEDLDSRGVSVFASFAVAPSSRSSVPASRGAGPPAVAPPSPARRPRSGYCSSAASRGAPRRAPSRARASRSCRAARTRDGLPRSTLLPAPRAPRNVLQRRCVDHPPQLYAERANMAHTPRQPSQSHGQSPARSDLREMMSTRQRRPRECDGHADGPSPRGVGRNARRASSKPFIHSAEPTPCASGPRRRGRSFSSDSSESEEPSQKRASGSAWTCHASMQLGSSARCSGRRPSEFMSTTVKRVSKPTCVLSSACGSSILAAPARPTMTNPRLASSRGGDRHLNRLDRLRRIARDAI